MKLRKKIFGVLSRFQYKPIHHDKMKNSSLAFIPTAVFVSAPQLLRTQYQTRNMHFGISGNIKDLCCSGTLGSLVTTAGTQYILSNNHVLARRTERVFGEDISQPGLIDNGCRRPTIVTDFTRQWLLVTTLIAPSLPWRRTMDSTGFIEGLGGPPSSTKASPLVGLAVAKKQTHDRAHDWKKSDRINAGVNVQYQIRCGIGRTYILSYTNQVVINSTTFSTGGDSVSSSRPTTAVIIRLPFSLLAEVTSRSQI